MFTPEELKARLYAGPVADIVQARRAYALLKTIGENVSEVSNPEHNFGELFASLQAQASDAALLHTARIFDRPSDQYSTVSIRSILRDMAVHAAVLPFRDTYNAGRELRDLGMEEAVVATVMSGSSASITRSIVEFVEAILEREDIKRKMVAVKAMRDKRIAHNEMFIGPFDALSWQDVLSLVGLAESIVTVIGSGYTTTVFGQDGRFFLTDDAERPSRALKRLLQKAGLLPPPPLPPLWGNTPSPEQ